MKVKDLLEVTSNRVLVRNDYGPAMDTAADGKRKVKFELGDYNIIDLKCDTDFAGNPLMVAIIDY